MERLSKKLKTTINNSHMAAKHFMMYYKRGTGTFIITEPLPWARENRELFPDYNFIDRNPNTIAVEKLLTDEYNFQKVIDTNEIVLIQNLDINLNL
jgi:hypothetical protein